MFNDDNDLEGLFEAVSKYADAEVRPSAVDAIEPAPIGWLYRETIGYGHTGSDVYAGETITEAQAVQYLKGDVASAEQAVQRCVAIVLTPNQFAALVSFEYNTGSLAGSPGLACINARQFETAWDDHFCLWIHDAAGAVQPGLVRRRAAEKALFFE